MRMTHLAFATLLSIMLLGHGAATTASSNDCSQPLVLTLGACMYSIGFAAVLLLMRYEPPTPIPRCVSYVQFCNVTSNPVIQQARAQIVQC